MFVGFEEGTLDTWDFVLAEHLSMSLAEVQSLSNLEHQQWKVFFAYRKAKGETDG